MTKRKSYNQIEKTLNAHAAEGFTAIQAQAANFEQLYQNAKAEIIAILRRQADLGKDPLVGKQYAALLESLKKEFSVFEGDLRKAAQLGINEVSGIYYDKCVKLLKSQGYGILSESISKTYVTGMVDDAWNHIAGATKKMQADHIKMLRDLSAKAFRQASLTGETRKSISQRLYSDAVNKFNGQFKFTAKNGAVWNSDVYFDMLGRTVLHNASRSAYLNACAANKADIVRVSVSGNPCPACAQFENRLFSISGTAPGIPSLDDAIAAGLFHPNCTHTITVVPASMQRKYFNADGRPQKGLNSPGNIQTAGKEDWSKYRKENKPVAKLINTPVPEIKLTQRLKKLEQEAVRYYTTNEGYEKINNAFRNKLLGINVSPEIEEKISYINSAIQKSKILEPVTVYRGLNNDILRKQLENGEKFIPIQHTQSTSLNKKKAIGFSKGNILLKTELQRSHKGLPLKEHSKYPNEEEILLPPTGQFTVTNVYYDKGLLIAEVDYEP